MSGAKAEIRVDLSGLEKRFSEGELKAKQAAFASRVAFETRDYVPLDEGTLRASEPLSSDYEAGEIEWNTPYAERVYDLPQSSIKTVKNPNAHSAWFEAAKADRLGAWEEFAKGLMGQ